MKAHKILIVDDEPDNIRAIRNCLTGLDEPYTIYQSLNGELAIKIASTELPDLIITDWEMPGMDGIDLIKSLKHDEATSEIPVIMCTGVMTTSENLHTALMAGAVDFVRKPIDKIELIARVKSMLELSDSRKELKERFDVIDRKSRFISTIMESISYPMVYYKVDGTIEGYNHHFEKLLKFNGKKFIGTNLYNLNGCKNNDYHKMHDKTIENNRLQLSYEGKLDDQYFIFSKTLYYNSSSNLGGIMCIMTNVTELKNAHHEILENKKRELTSGAIRLIQLSEMNNSIVEQLEHVYNQPNDRKNELIRSAINRLNNTSGENIYHEFELHFSNVFESFYKTIKNQYPDLTPGELKLCAFLRLNLSSKEIAALTFQNPKSIDMARYRLRKKMNLDQDENLTEFLMRIN